MGNCCHGGVDPSLLANNTQPSSVEKRCILEDEPSDTSSIVTPEPQDYHPDQVTYEPDEEKFQTIMQTV